MEDFAQSSSSLSRGNAKRPERFFWFLLIIIVLVVAVIYLLSLFTPIDLFGMQGKKGGGSSYKKYTQSEWQAVFLDNGQVYFGKVENERSDLVFLRDIYYLQVTQPLQQLGEGQAPVQSQPQLSLVKLGEEIHGPMSEMRINREHILFIEDLKDTSKVVEAITRSLTDAAK